MLLCGLKDEPTRPASDYWETATGNMVSQLDGARSRYVSAMYDQARELEQAYGTWRHLRKNGEFDKAREFKADHADELKRYRRVELVKRQAATINERIRRIERSDLDPSAKRDKINELRHRQAQIAKRLTGF